MKWWLIHIGPRRDVTVDTFNGRLTFNSKDWLVGKHLYVRRGHEESEIRSVVDLLTAEGWLGRSSAGATVLNVGANIGMTCIALVREGGVDRAVAFEPDPENFRLLTRNIGQNQLQGRIEAVCLALSSRTVQLNFELSPDNCGDHRVRQVDRPGFYREESRRTIVVEGETVDRFFEKRTDRIDMIWVDIQGHEGHFFLGAKQFLKRRIPVVTEFWPYGLARAGTSPEDLICVLAGEFKHFWVIGNEQYQRSPIEEIKRLYDAYNDPRNFCLVVLAPKGS